MTPQDVQGGVPQVGVRAGQAFLDNGIGEPAGRAGWLVEQNQCRLAHARVGVAQGGGKGRFVRQVVQGVHQGVFQEAVGLGGQGTP
jgi:hypothetical protein